MFYRIYEFINITRRGVFPIKNKRAPVPKISKWSRFRKISLCNESLLVDCLIMFSFWLLTKHIDITSGNSITCTLFKIMIVYENGQIIAVMKSVIKLCNPKSDCWNQVQYMIHLWNSLIQVGNLQVCSEKTDSGILHFNFDKQAPCSSCFETNLYKRYSNFITVVLQVLSFILWIVFKTV